jgi:rRNA processing protein Gar1
VASWYTSRRKNSYLSAIVLLSSLVVIGKVKPVLGRAFVTFAAVVPFVGQ